MWVAVSDDRTVVRVATGPGGTELTPVAVGAGPIAVAIANGTVVVINQDNSSLSRVDADTAAAVGEPARLGTLPRGIAYGAGAIWAVGVDPSRVIRLNR